MRWLVWCLAGCLLACGKSESREDVSGSGKGGSGGGATAGSSSGAGASTGSSAGNGGAEVAEQPATAGTASGSSGEASSSGASPNAGTANTSAGSGGSAGDATGNGGSAEDGGNSGSAGSEAGGDGSGSGGRAGSGGAAGSGGRACETYNACGCGCCDPSPRDTACVYPDNGEDFDAIIAEDQAAAAEPSCDDALCERGTRHFCCAVPGVDPSVTYEGSSMPGGRDHIQVLRTAEDGRCTAAGISYPSSQPSRHPFEPPPGWSLSYVANYPCEAPASDDYSAIGVFGWMRWTTEDECAVDFDFTGFFRSEDGTLESLRFAGENLRIEGYGALSCDL